MPDHQATQNQLRTCLKKAGNDPDERANCQRDFETAGGTVTPDGGKVFSTPDGDATFQANGGKVFVVQK